MSSGQNDSDLRQQIQELQQQVADLEMALEGSEKNFRSLTDSAPVGIYLDDAEGQAVYINKKCAELVGVPAEDALNFNWIPLLHPDDRERMVLAWKEAFETSGEFHLEYRWVHPDGKVVWTLGEVVPILGDDGKATMFIGTLTDISAQKKAEVEKHELEEQLAQAQKMESIGRLAGGVAHDYNNMLSAIISYTELAMIEVGKSNSVYSKLQEVLKAATRSAEVTHQLLSFARKQIVLPEAFDINDAVNDMFNMLRRLIGEHIDLVWAPRAGQIPIKMDRAQLDQIVVNLCINARDAITDAGRITIETATVIFDDTSSPEQFEGASGEFALLSVSDNGRGMDEATLGNIFEPFFTTKDQNTGTGLGLASVYGTVKQNNGFIDVHSKLGVGTTFKIYLPLYRDGLHAERLLKSGPLTRGRGETILVVEDEPSILEAVTMILEDLDYKVMSANTSSEALNLVHHYHEDIDLLITDVIMPEMNGRDLANRIRANRPDIKCLYMSGYTANMIASQEELEDPVNFLQKPFSIEDLIAKVGEALNRT